MYNEQIKKDFLTILSEELVPAMGCTEPIALAYAAAKARELLGRTPTRIIARCSGNIIKNVRCVRIPNSDGMTGIEAACTLGALAGDAERQMEVLESVCDEDRANTIRFLREGRCTAEFLESNIPLHFIIELRSGNSYSIVEVRHSHRNIYKLEKDGEIIFLGEETEDLT